MQEFCCFEAGAQAARSRAAAADVQQEREALRASLFRGAPQDSLGRRRPEGCSAQHCHSQLSDTRSAGRPPEDEGSHSILNLGILEHEDVLEPPAGRGMR